LLYLDFLQFYLLWHALLATNILLSGFAALLSGCNKKLPFYMALAATVLIIASPFIGYGVGYQNNYVPIFDNTVFKAGIALFLASITLVCLGSRLTPTSALILFSFACFVASYVGIADKTSSHYLYEYMFWGGGHVLQFAYVQIMVTAWLALGRPHPYPKLLWLPFALAALSSIYIYANYKVESAEYITLFTKQMIWLSSIGVLLVLPFIRTRNLAVYLSVALFFIGGSLGHMIGEVSTTVIPAHYHGSVMAVTIAIMGLAYHKLGMRPHKLQLWLYFIGQATHVICMAVMGFHGASRKTPGDMGTNTAKMWAGIMDFGGLLVLIGGVMFVVLILSRAKASAGDPRIGGKE
jgi:cytochrome c oxidase subunit 1